MPSPEVLNSPGSAPEEILFFSRELCYHKLEGVYRGFSAQRCFEKEKGTWIGVVLFPILSYRTAFAEEVLMTENNQICVIRDAP